MHGFLWLFSQTVVTRLVNFAGQLTLAWLLEPSAFGLIALATSIQAFTSLTQQNGLNQILVARQSEYLTLANPAFWYSLATGLFAAILMAGAAPLASHAFGHAELLGLILIMAAATPFEAMRAIPEAKLGIDLRFGVSAVVNAGSMTVSMLLTVVLAALDFGVYSFVLPLLVTAPATTLVFFLLTNPPLRLNPDIHHWRTLLGVSGLLLLTGICNRLNQRGDYLILSAFYSAELVGIYFLAYMLSVQSVMLLSNNLGNILFPTLSKLRQEPDRQVAAFIRSARMLTMVAMPASFALAVAADPLVQIFLPDKWLPTIPVLQILALGMALRILISLAHAHIRSQARFSVLLVSALVQCLIFFALLLTGAPFGLLYFAAAVSMSFVFAPLIATFFALGFNLKTIVVLTRILAAPLLSSLLSVAVTAPLAAMAPETSASRLSVVAIILAVFIIISIGVTRKFTPTLWYDFIALASTYVPRFTYMYSVRST